LSLPLPLPLPLPLSLFRVRIQLLQQKLFTIENPGLQPRVWTGVVPHLQAPFPRHWNSFLLPEQIQFVRQIFAREKSTKTLTVTTLQI
jgi:hypothetical protein